MALALCEFKLNGKAISQLNIKFNYRNIQVPAFSGLSSARNDSKKMCLPDMGAIPKGSYYIVDRESGGRLGWLFDRMQNRSEWFALYAIDSKIDDQTLCNGIIRGQFRLHPAGVLATSRGCITLPNMADYELIRNELRSNGKFKVGRAGLEAYGMLTVS
ncbi:MAG TPA: DUF2778 domain-containing protein [Limnobacter sp.]|nr:DUF2778 domain-containing protein [Limnobacter sp.]